MERIVDPLIADLQHEHARTVQERRVWRSRVVHIAGWIVSFKVLVICAWKELAAAERWTADERKGLVRMLAMTPVLIVGLTGAFLYRSGNNYPSVLLHVSSKRFLYLAPVTFVGAVAVGPALGLMFGFVGRRVTRRLAATAILLGVAASAATFVDVGWVRPASLIRYRILVFGETDPTPRMGEQSIAALARHIETFTDPAFAHFGYLGALSFDYHTRVAISFSPLVFTLLALSMMFGGFRRRWILGAAVCVLFVGWSTLRGYITPWGRVQLPAYVAAWAPEGAILATAALITLISTHQRRARRLPAT